jgi:hypothetical protein
MAKRGVTATQVARDISAEVRKIRSAVKRGEYNKTQERIIAAAIKRLDVDLKDLRNLIHPWEFGRLSK